MPLFNKALWASSTKPAYKLLVWGANASGQLGLGTVVSYSSPVQLGSSGEYALISTGESAAVAIKPNGTLWSWGGGNSGRNGQNNTINYSSPVQVGSLNNWKEAATLISVVRAIKTDGTLWAWGSGANGALGLNNTINYSSPVQVGSLNNWKTLLIATVAGSGGAIKTNGTLWSWGTGNSGRNGQNNILAYSSPVQVGSGTDWAQATGNTSSVLAIKTDGTLWAWGSGANGALGLNNTINYSSPVQVGSLNNWKKVRYSGVTTICALALKTDGTLWAWGRGTEGALGLNNTISYSSPVQVGSDTDWADFMGGGGASAGFLAIKTNGTLWSWGTGNSGHNGQNNTLAYSSPVQVGSLNTWRAVGIGGSGGPAAFST